MYVVGVETDYAAYFSSFRKPMYQQKSYFFKTGCCASVPSPSPEAHHALHVVLVQTIYL
jgi:hypothetical protein